MQSRAPKTAIKGIKVMNKNTKNLNVLMTNDEMAIGARTKFHMKFTRNLPDTPKHTYIVKITFLGEIHDFFSFYEC